MLMIEDRSCIICNSGETEDEMHFLMNCKAYELPRASMTNQTRRKFLYILILMLLMKISSFRHKQWIERMFELCT